MKKEEEEIKLPEFPDHLKVVPEEDLVDKARAYFDFLRSVQLSSELRAVKSVLNAQFLAREDSLKYAVKLGKVIVENTQLGQKVPRNWGILAKIFNKTTIKWIALIVIALIAGNTLITLFG